MTRRETDTLMQTPFFVFVTLLLAVGLTACDMSEPPKKRPAKTQQGSGVQEAGEEPAAAGEEPVAVESNEAGEDPANAGNTGPVDGQKPPMAQPRTIELRPQIQMVQPRTTGKPLSAQPRKGVQLRTLKRTPTPQPVRNNGADSGAPEASPETNQEGE